MPLKNPPTPRQWKLISILKESKGGSTLKALAERLKVTERTIQRDLAKLIEHGLPILEMTEAHGRKLWFSKEDPFVPAKFDFEEAAALYLGHRFLAPLANSSLWEASERGLQKIREQRVSDETQNLRQGNGHVEYRSERNLGKMELYTLQKFLTRRVFAKRFGTERFEKLYHFFCPLW